MGEGRGAMAVSGSRYASPRPDTDAARGEYRDEPPLHGDDAADLFLDGQGGRLGAEIFLGVGFVRQRRCPTGPGFVAAVTHRKASRRVRGFAESKVLTGSR